MKPTEEEVTKCLNAFNTCDGYPHPAMEAAIAHWESIRPPCPELAQLKTILADPNAVRINMLRGTIAWTTETLRSVLGDSDQVEVDKLRADIAELNQRLHDRTQAFLGMAGRDGR